MLRSWLLPLLRGGAQGAWREGLPGFRESVDRPAAASAELYTPDEGGVREGLVGEVGQGDHIVRASPVAQGAHLDADLVGGRFFEGALDLLGPLYYGAGERLGGVVDWTTGPVARDCLGREPAAAVGRATEPAARDERGDERERDNGSEV